VKFCWCGAVFNVHDVLNPIETGLSTSYGTYGACSLLIDKLAWSITHSRGTLPTRQISIFLTQVIQKWFWPSILTNVNPCDTPRWIGHARPVKRMWTCISAEDKLVRTYVPFHACFHPDCFVDPGSIGFVRNHAAYPTYVALASMVLLVRRRFGKTLSIH
jgi:hypothetical protein